MAILKQFTVKNLERAKNSFYSHSWHSFDNFLFFNWLWEWHRHLSMKRTNYDMANHRDTLKLIIYLIFMHFYFKWIHTKHITNFNASSVNYLSTICLQKWRICFETCSFTRIQHISISNKGHLFFFLWTSYYSREVPGNDYSWRTKKTKYFVKV